MEGAGEGAVRDARVGLLQRLPADVPPVPAPLQSLPKRQVEREEHVIVVHPLDDTVAEVLRELARAYFVTVAPPLAPPLGARCLFILGAPALGRFSV